MIGTSLTRRAMLKGAAAFTALGTMAGRASANILDSLGLKNMLGNASDGALDKLAEPDGFYRDVAIRILLPGAKGKFARKLMNTGDKLGVTKKLTRSLNDAASLAAKEAKPVFRSAISGLKLSDVPGIATKKDGATQYLQTTAGSDLRLKVRPLVETALGKVGAFEQLSKLSSAGGLLSSLGISNEKLTDSVADQAMKGIFSYIGAEEGKIRANPTKILKKIF
jgi:hypothetical protein